MLPAVLTGVELGATPTTVLDETTVISTATVDTVSVDTATVDVATAEKVVTSGEEAGETKREGEGEKEEELEESIEGVLADVMLGATDEDDVTLGNIVVMDIMTPVVGMSNISDTEVDSNRNEVVSLVVTLTVFVTVTVPLWHDEGRSSSVAMVTNSLRRRRVEDAMFGGSEPVSVCVCVCVCV